MIIPRRLVSNYFEATEEEQQAMFRLAGDVKRQLDQLLPKPDAYNLGINAGAAAGQTVLHLHLHLIPRYNGDVADPRGGVRWVVPGKAAYW